MRHKTDKESTQNSHGFDTSTSQNGVCPEFNFKTLRNAHPQTHQQELRKSNHPFGHFALHSQRGNCLHPRSVGLRQNDTSQSDSRSDTSLIGKNHVRRRGPHKCADAKARFQHCVPRLRTFPELERLRQHHLRSSQQSLRFDARRGE